MKIRHIIYWLVFIASAFSISASAQVTIPELDGTICAGTKKINAVTDLQIANNAPFMYQWSTGETSQSIDFSFSDAPVTIGVTVTDKQNKTYTYSKEVDPIELKVNAPEFISGVSGQKIDFNMSFSGGTPPYTPEIYSWSLPITEVTEGFYRTDQLSEDSNISGKIDNSGCQTIINIPVFKTNSEATIQSKNGNTVCSNGGALVLLVSSLDFAGNVVFWQVDGVVKDTLSIDDAFVYNFSGGEKVEAVCKDEINSVLVRSNPQFTVGVSAYVNNLSLQLDPDVYEAQGQNINVVVTGNTGFVNKYWSYQSNVFVATNLALNPVNRPYEGYSIIGADNCTKAAKFLVLPKLTSENFSIELSSPSCYGEDSFELLPVLPENFNDYTYEWYLNNDVQPFSTRNYARGSYADLDSVTLKVSYAGNFIGWAGITLHMKNPTSVEIKTPESIMVGVPVEMSAINKSTGLAMTATDGTFFWTSDPWDLIDLSNNSNPSVTIRALSSLTEIYLGFQDAITGCYSSVIKNVSPIGGDLAASIRSEFQLNKLCFGEPVTLTAYASGGTVPGNDQTKYTFQWSSVPAGFNSTDANIVITPSVNTVYSVVVSDGATSAAASVSVSILKKAEYTKVITQPNAYMANNGAVELSMPLEYDAIKQITIENNDYSDRVSLSGLAPDTLSARFEIFKYESINACAIDTIVINEFIPELEIIEDIFYTCPGTATGSIGLTVNNAIGKVNYEWSTGSMAPKVSELGEGTYSVTVSAQDSQGNKQSKVVTYSLNAYEDYSYSPTIMPVDCGMATGGVASFPLDDVFPDPQYMWANGKTGVMVDTLKAGDYEVTVTDSHGCIDIVKFTVGAKLTPLVNIGNDTLICAGDLLTLYAPAFMDGDQNSYSYTWGDGTSRQMLDVTEPGSYSVTVTSVDGCTATDDIFVGEVSSDPHNICNINILPSGATELTLNEYGFEYIQNYKVFRDDELIATVPHSDGNIFVDEYADAQTAVRSYTIMAQNICNEVSPLSFPKQTPFLLGARVGNENVLTWQVMSSTSPIHIYRGTTATNMEIYDIAYVPNRYADPDPIPKAYYKVLIDDIINCSAPIRTNTVEISVLPEIDFSVSDALVAVGQEVEFSASFTKTDSFVWDFEGGSIAKSSANIVTQKYTTPGTYDVKLTAENTNGKDSIVRQDYITVAGINERNEFKCYGDSLVFTATPIAGATYTWSNGKTGPSVKFLAEKTGSIGLTITTDQILVPITDEVSYSVSIPVSLADVAVPCKGDSTLVTFSGYETYSWNHSAESPNAQYYISKEEMKYHVKAIDAKGCISSDSIIMGTFLPLPVVSLGADRILCAGSSVQLIAETTGTVVWNTNAKTPSITVASSGNYYADVTENGCLATDTVMVTVLSAPKIQYGGVTADEAGNAAIFWPVDNAFVQYTVKKETNTSGEYITIGVVSANDSSYMGHNGAVLGTTAGLYQIVAVDTCGSETAIDASSIHLQLNKRTSGGFNLSWTVPTGITVPSYYIFRGTNMSDMQLFQTISGSSTNINDIDPIEGALYAVGVKADVPSKFLVGNWQDGYMISNIVESGYTTPLPTVDFKANRTHVGVGSTVLFTSLTQKANTIKWEFEGGSPTTATDPLVIVEYNTAGTYSVRLSAANDDGKDTLVRIDYITVGGVEAESIRFLADTIVMKVGEFVMPQLSFDPFDTENKSVNFTSSSNNVFFEKSGTVFSVGEGEATLYASTETTAGIITDSVVISVKGFVVAKDIVLPYTIWINAGEERAIAPVLVPFTLGRLDLTWAVSNSILAEISPDGTLLAKAPGIINISANDPRSGITVTVPVVIGNEDVPSSVSIPETMEIAAGWAYNVPLQLTPISADGQTVIWSSSDPNLVTVTADGVIKPVTAGLAYVVAAIGSSSDTCYLTILPSKRPELAIPVTASLIEGTTKEMFILNMVDDDNTLAQNIRWEFFSSNNILVDETNSIMSMSATSNASGTETIKIVAIDADNLTDTAEVAVTIIPKDTIPPVISLPTINILKGTKSKVINLLNYVKDDYTEPTFISTNVTGIVPGTTLDEYLNILTITLADDAPLYSKTFTLTVKDDDDNTTSAQIAINHSDIANKKPVIVRIPNQEQMAGGFFSALMLRTYVTDDYTLPADIQWSVSGMAQLSATIRNGRLFVTASDPKWTGSEQLTLTATDEHGASSQRTVWFTQIAAKPEVWTAKPEVSFKASTRYTVPGRAIDFYGSVNGSSQLYWEFEGAEPAVSAFTQPTVVYNTQGVYDVSLSALNSYGKTVQTQDNYITVVGIDQRNLAVCAGETAELKVVAEGFTGYEWSTGETTASISISPLESAYYVVTITKGLTIVVDSVFVTVTNGLNLGADTSICQGTQLRLGASGYTEYYWNGSSVAGNAFIDADEAATYSLLAKDAAGCQFKDTIVITDILPSPHPVLGDNQTLCDGEFASITCSETGSYLWNTGATTSSISVNTTGEYMLTVTANNGCKGSDTVLVTFMKPVVTNIGVVTISESGKNLIAWERKRGQNIKSYLVYRETKTIGEFDLIGERPFDSLSVVIDTASRPEVKQDLYGIRTIDSCGNISAMCPLHKPIELNYFENSLSWKPYSVENGELPYLSYIIYRGMKGGKLTPIDTINAKLTSYNDPEKVVAGTVYRVSILLRDKVVPTVLKNDSGPFSQSMSNLAEAVVVGTEEPSFAGTFDISPNPFTDIIELTAAGGELAGATYIICTQVGTVVSSGTISNGSATANLSHLPVGTYIARLSTASGSAFKIIVKE